MAVRVEFKSHGLLGNRYRYITAVMLRCAACLDEVAGAK